MSDELITGTLMFHGAMMEQMEAPILRTCRHLGGGLPRLVRHDPRRQRLRLRRLPVDGQGRPLQRRFLLPQAVNHGTKPRSTVCMRNSMFFFFYVRAWAPEYLKVTV